MRNIGQIRKKRLLLTAIIPTFNEEDNIRHVVESVLWADKVYIVDSFSTDKTAELAKSYAPKVEVVQHEWEGYARQKNWALDNLDIKTEWILILDADEIVPEKLKQEIEEVISQKNDCSGFWIRRRYIFLGKTLRFCVGRGTAVLRLFRKGRGRYEDRAVHERLIVDGKVGWLKEPIVHHDRKLLFFYLSRHNKFSDLESKERYERWYDKSVKTDKFNERLFGTNIERNRWIKNRIWKYLPFKALIRFMHIYFFKLGFLDGKVGFTFCVHKAVQEFYTNLKIRELKLRKKQGTIQSQ